MKYVDAELLKSKTAPSFTGQNKKTWEQIKTINGIRLFDNVSSTKLINGVRYEKADYVGLTFDFSISKKHRLKSCMPSFVFSSYCFVFPWCFSPIAVFCI